MRDYIIVFGAIVLVVGSCFLRKREFASLKNNGLKTEATIVDFQSKETIVWTYLVNGDLRKIYERGKKLNNLQIGEMFEAKYDPTNLKVGTIDLTKPIFEKSGIDSTNMYEIQNGGIKANNYTVTFKYQVDDKEYLRVQKLPRKSDWHKIKNFIVIYNKENPIVGYLFPR